MKKSYYIAIAILLLTFSFVFRANNSQSLSQKFTRDLEALLTEASDLRKLTTKFNNHEISLFELQNQLNKTRMSYKKIEFLIEFYNPKFTEEKLNGAPLLHVEISSNFPVIIPPEGLQVLDELLFEAEIDIDKSQLAILTKKFESNCLEFKIGVERKKITNVDLIEAIKYQLIRIGTLGISGFDTPGSSNGINETKASLIGLKEYLAVLELNNDVADSLANQFGKAIQFINSSNIDFETFDRVTFTRNHLSPIYRYINQLFISRSIPSSAVNPEANFMFENDFLDPYFYTLLTKEEDSEALRNLGKKLFHDSRLSENGLMSCGSCHAPEKAFSDGKKKSISNLINETVERNSPSLINAVYADRYFFDLRAFNLEQQVEHVIFNKKEYNTAYHSIVEKLNADEEYRTIFKKIFKKKTIDRLDFSKALSSYVLSLRSFNSEFDQFMRNELKSIDQRVINGYNLFMGKAACGTCHFPPTFAGLVPPYYNKNETEILGVLETPFSFNKKIDNDSGRINNGLSTENAWIYTKSFKTNTVRNVAYSAPYFHNGAYPTLESVLDFYNHGGGAGIGLEVTNQTLSSDSLNLSTSEKTDIIFFLNSLSDTSLNMNFKNP